MRLPALLPLLLCALPSLASAQILSRTIALDYQRDITSRNLAGLAARADGRLISGPFLSELKGPSLGSMVWSLAALPDGRWVVGSGPSGRLTAVTIDAAQKSYTAATWIDLPVGHVHALVVTPDGAVLAGGSPGSALFLVRDGKLLAQASLGSEVIHALVLDPAQPNRAFAATGNPARVFAIDLAAFAKAGLPAAGKPALTREAQGITAFGEIRDRHLRRLVFAGGALIGGSSPRGHIYRFLPNGGPGIVMMENKDTEVTSLLPLPDGDVLASLVIAAPETENRVSGAPAPAPTPAPSPAPGAPPTAGALNAPRPGPSPFDRFGGRSQLVRVPARGTPEILAQRANTAFYDLALQGNLVLIAGGETGDMMAYDLDARLPMTLAGSPSAQLTRLAASPSTGGLLVLRNNPAGLSLLRDETDRPRTAETKRIDLGALGLIGAWRPQRIRSVDTEKTVVEARLSRTSDEAEGWSPWHRMTYREDGWFLPHALARYVKYRLTFPAGTGLALERAETFLLPENRRPGVSEFRYLPPNFEIRPPLDTPPAPQTTVAALLNPDRPDPKARNPINGAQALPSPGMQAAIWTVVDADGDTLSANLSIKAEGTDQWIPVAVDRRDSYCQFATSGLAEGSYLTRLTVNEQAPRPAAERLSFTAETDTLVIDRTGPEILLARASRDTNEWVVTIDARDALSPLDHVELAFNQGYEAVTGQPSDGLRDSRRETFEVRVPIARSDTSTSVEVTVYDSVGNATRTRLELR